MNMKKRLLTATLCGTLTIVLAAPPAFSQVSTSPGKNAAFYSSQHLVSIDPPAEQTFAVTIAKGRPKRVVTLTATVNYQGRGGFPDPRPYLRAWVNGVRMTGAFAPNYFADYWGEKDYPGFISFRTATWWLDLDAAEAANPGQFKNQPLTVELDVGDEGFDGFNASVTMSARMEKK